MATAEHTPLSSLQIAWLAGLLEGEGCFSKGGPSGGTRRPDGRQRQITVTLAMTDCDVVQRVADMLGTRVGLKSIPADGRQKQYMCRIYSSRAAAWMMTLYSFLGERRRARVRELLAYWRTQPIANANKQHCPLGHAFIRSLRRRGVWRRICRVCERQAYQRYANKKRAIRESLIPAQTALWPIG
jgi:hypothetical protein